MTYQEFQESLYKRADFSEEETKTLLDIQSRNGELPEELAVKLRSAILTHQDAKENGDIARYHKERALAEFDAEVQSLLDMKYNLGDEEIAAITKAQTPAEKAKALVEQVDKKKTEDSKRSITAREDELQNSIKKYAIQLEQMKQQVSNSERQVVLEKIKGISRSRNLRSDLPADYINLLPESIIRHISTRKGKVFLTDVGELELQTTEGTPFRDAKNDRVLTVADLVDSYLGENNALEKAQKPRQETRQPESLPPVQNLPVKTENEGGTFDMKMRNIARMAESARQKLRIQTGQA